ncbi:MAG: hypothetical protein GX628_02030 [Clostridiales bacterium]|nr:hypothetical protein [Clostridiales bacterium]
MNKIKLTALLLLLALTVGAALTACGGDTSSGSSSDTGEAAAETTVDEETSPFEPDSLPSDLNFDGATFTTMYRAEEVDEYFMAEQSGDIVDDAVYRSNRNVEERLNVKLAVKTQIGNPNDERAKFINTVTSTVLAGDDEFQAVGMLTYNMPTLVQNGVTLNLNTLPHIDFDKPWWVSDLTTLGSIDDKLYIVSGDISLSLVKKTLCLFFNSDLCSSLGIDSPYDSVLDGSWTKERMEADAKKGYVDLNGNGEGDFDDQYGYMVYDSNHFNMYIGAFDLMVTDVDSNGYPVPAFGSEKVVNAVEYIVGLLWDNEGIGFNNLSDAGADLSKHEAVRNIFTSGRLLFISAEFFNSDFYRDMEQEYGVLPAPKWDDKQDGYYTVARNVYSSFIVPITIQDAEMTGAVLEAIASENYRTLSPVYFESALKVKYSRDLQSAQMYDLIKEGMKFNFGYTYHIIVGLTDSLRDAINGKKTDWASTYAAKEAAAQARIDAFVEIVKALP